MGADWWPGWKECPLDLRGAFELGVEVELLFDPGGEVVQEGAVGGAEAAWAVVDEAEGADVVSARGGEWGAGVEADGGVGAFDVGVVAEAFVEQGIFDDGDVADADGGGAERVAAGDLGAAARGAVGR